MIHLVTDSTSDLSASAAAAIGVRVVPLTVRFGDESFLDNVDLSGDEFYARLKSGDGGHPATSQPSPERFAEVYRECLREPGDEVVSVHLPGGLSGTAQSAHLAAQQTDAARIHVVDSGTLSAALQFLLRTAREDIDGGADAAAVVRNIEDRRSRAGILVAIETLTYLQRGGRIGRAQAFVGGVLSVRPILAILQGEVLPRTRVRSRQKALDTLVELLHSEAGAADHIGVMYTDDAAEGRAMGERLQGDYPNLVVTVGQLGPVVGTYGGPGALGVAWLRR